MRSALQFGLLISMLLLGSYRVGAHPVILVTYTSGVQGNPNFSLIQTAVSDAISTFESLFTNNVTLRFTITENSSGLTSNSFANFVFSDYATIKGLMTADVTSSDQASAAASLPATDPTAGLLGGWVIPGAEAKALGISGVSQTASDGTIWFNSTLQYTYDPLNREAPGKYDFIGAIEHEFSELMGRTSQIDSAPGSGFVPYDLFRFSASGTRSFADGPSGIYFSLNDGTTNLQTFNSTAPGDIQDWNGATANDAFNAVLAMDRAYTLTPVDMQAMNIAGWDLAAPELPWPISGAVAMGIIAAHRRRSRPRNNSLPQAS